MTQNREDIGIHTGIALMEAPEDSPEDIPEATRTASEVGSRARKRSLRKMPVVVIVALVMALGCGVAVGGPTLYDKFVVPSFYQAVMLEVTSDMPQSSAPGYKETVGIGTGASLEEIASGNDTTIKERISNSHNGDFSYLINVVTPGHEEGVALDGVIMPCLGKEKLPITTWGDQTQSYSGVYIYAGPVSKGEDMSLGQPKSVSVYADGKLVGTAMLNAESEPTYQRIEFSRSIDARYLSLNVDSIYPAEGDPDLGDDAQEFELFQITPY